MAVSKKNYVWLRIIDPSVSTINVSSKALCLAIDMIETIIEFHSVRPILPDNGIDETCPPNNGMAKK